MLLIAKIAGHTHASAIIWRGCSRGCGSSSSASTPGQWERPTEAVLDFMAAGTAGLICEHLADAKSADEFDAAFSAIARTFGKSALYYARERELVAQTG